MKILLDKVHKAKFILENITLWIKVSQKKVKKNNKTYKN